MKKKLHFDYSTFREPNFPFKMRIEKKHEDYPEHTHEFVELVIVLDGFATHKIDGRMYEIHAGDVYLIRGKTAHRLINMNNIEVCYIMFNQEKLLLPLFDLKQIEGFHSFFIFEPYFRKSHNFQNKLHLDYECVSKVKSYINELLNEYENRPKGYRTRITLLLNDLIIYLSREYYQRQNYPANNTIRLSKVIMYMEDSFLESVRLSDLADMAHLSERQFTRVFRNNFNQSPIDFLINLRIKHACQLLEETKLPINQVAFQSGFPDPNYFSRLFKKKTNLSAFDYRIKQNTLETQIPKV